MSNMDSRGTRRFLDGTGAYIALFVVVTALAVAGYWSLIPHSTSGAVPSMPEQAPVLPAPSETNPVTALPEIPVREAEEQKPRDYAPAHSAVTVELPEPEVTESVDLEPAPPSLVVAPLIGETVAAFSIDELQYNETMGDWRTHDGMDIAAEPGTQVCAAAAGTVLDVRNDDLMGTTVVLSHDGGYDTIYANLQAVPTVEVGDYVTAGQVIGSVGHTALSEAAEPTHLHFGVTKDGEYVDPAEFLQ